MPSTTPKYSYVKNGVLYVELSRGHYAQIDPELAEIVLQYSWCAAADRNGYLAAQTSITTPEGKRVTLKLHHLIAGQPLKGHCIDHINGNSLDNRRENLRPCTKAQNARNQTKVRGEVSYKGVRRTGQRYRADITFQSKRISLGTHATAELAAQAYNEGALHYFGEFAALNDIPALLLAA